MICSKFAFQDPSFYKSLEFFLNNPIEELGTELTFSLEVEEFGVRRMRMLKENGSSIPVTDENKEEYVKLVCQMKMTGSFLRLKLLIVAWYQCAFKDCWCTLENYASK